MTPSRCVLPANRNSGKDDLLTDGAPFYLDGDQVIVALRRVQTGADSAATPDPAADSGSPSSPNNERMYAIDAGGQQTYLTSRYFDEHAAEFNSMKVDLYAPPGEVVRIAALVHFRDGSAGRGKRYRRAALHSRAHAAARFRRSRRCVWHSRRRRSRPAQELHLRLPNDALYGRRRNGAGTQGRV